MKSWICLWLAGLLTSSFTSNAKAETRVAVLGVRAVDGDTELERRLSTALRETVASFGDFVLAGDRQLSLEQMTLAHGCDDADAPCLGQIATTLEAERLFYGDVDAAERGYELTIFMFDARKSSVENVSLRQLTSDQLGSSGAAKATISRLVQRLTGRVMTGYIIVSSPSKLAEVEVDGTRRGKLDEAGMFTLELPIGEHMVRIVPRGDGPSEERAVRIKPGESTQLNIDVAAPQAAVAPVAVEQEADSEPSPRPRRSLRRIFGWVSVGLGAAFAAGTIYSWVRLKQISEDSDWNAYRHAYPKGSAPGGVKNVCSQADKGALGMMDPALAKLERSAKDLCKEADLLEVAQYVLLGGAIVGGGVGSYLLLTSPRPRASGDLSLRPRFDGQGAMIEASAAF